jgi:hypothetical protein
VLRNASGSAPVVILRSEKKAKMNGPQKEVSLSRAAAACGTQAAAPPFEGETLPANLSGPKAEMPK